MSQIIDALKGYVTPELISAAASHLGESNSAVSKGLTGMLPVLLGGMASKADNSSAMSGLFDLIKGSGDAGVLGNLAGLLGGGGATSGLTSSLLSMLFGGNSEGLLGGIAKFAGLKGGSSSALMGLVAPMVTGYLSKMIGAQGLDLSKFTSLLTSQKSSFASALPAGLAALPALGSLGLSMSDIKGNIPKVEVPKVEVPKVNTPKGGGGFPKWLLPLIAVAALAFGGFKFLGGCGEKVAKTAENTVNSAKDVAKGAANVAEGAAGAVAGAAEDAAKGAANVAEGAAGAVAGAAEGALATLGNFFSRKLPNGVELNIPEMGVENKLVKFIEGSNPVDKTSWFNFDRLNFKTGSAQLDMDKSKEQLDNMVAILKAYPKVSLKIGGYTDNTGSEATNIKISGARANAVKSHLVANGIAAARLDAEGYGPKHPVASNDTPEGRAQNRRVAVRVSAK